MEIIENLSSNKFFLCARGLIKDISIEIYIGSILDTCEMRIECIVNPANQHLNHSGGLAGAIASKAGPELEEESVKYIKKYGALPKATAISTTAGKLNFKRVIHVAGPIVQNKWLRPGQTEELSLCVYNSILKACSEELNSIAIPAISCGIFGFPIKEAAQSHLKGYYDYANDIGTMDYYNNNINGKKTVKKVCFILFTLNEAKEFTDEFLNKIENYDYSYFIGIPINQDSPKYKNCGMCSSLISNELFRIDKCHKKYCDFCIYRYKMDNCLDCGEPFERNKENIPCRICNTFAAAGNCCSNCSNVCNEHKSINKNNSDEFNKCPYCLSLINPILLNQRTSHY
jgi:O-acetyl-ADP-ribose deacetylase